MLCTAMLWITVALCAQSPRPRSPDSRAARSIRKGAMNIDSSMADSVIWNTLALINCNWWARWIRTRPNSPAWASCAAVRRLATSGVFAMRVMSSMTTALPPISRATASTSLWALAST